MFGYAREPIERHRPAWYAAFHVGRIATIFHREMIANSFLKWKVETRRIIPNGVDKCLSSDHRCSLWRDAQLLTTPTKTTRTKYSSTAYCLPTLRKQDASMLFFGRAGINNENMQVP